MYFRVEIAGEERIVDRVLVIGQILLPAVLLLAIRLLEGDRFEGDAVTKQDQGVQSARRRRRGLPPG
jgi:hypothetical protein